jgi:hypothetical protein
MNNQLSHFSFDPKLKFIIYSFKFTIISMKTIAYLSILLITVITEFTADGW